MFIAIKSVSWVDGCVPMVASGVEEVFHTFDDAVNWLMHTLRGTGALRGTKDERRVRNVINRDRRFRVYDQKKKEWLDYEIQEKRITI